jgi:hypothetical protein
LLARDKAPPPSTKLRTEQRSKRPEFLLIALTRTFIRRFHAYILSFVSGQAFSSAISIDEMELSIEKVEIHGQKPNK